MQCKIENWSRQRDTLREKECLPRRVGTCTREMYFEVAPRPLRNVYQQQHQQQVFAFLHIKSV